MGLKYVVKGVSVLKDLSDLENIIVGFKQAESTASPLTSGSATASTSERVPVYLRDVASVQFEQQGSRKHSDYQR